MGLRVNLKLKMLIKVLTSICLMKFGACITEMRSEILQLHMHGGISQLELFMCHLLLDSLSLEDGNPIGS